MKAFLVTILLLAAANASAAEPLFGDHDPRSDLVVDHANWDKLLAGMVLERAQILALAQQETRNSTNRIPTSSRLKKGVDINYIPYRIIKEEYADVLFVLQVYIDQMRNVPVSRLARDEQLAYWLNLRNALVMQTIFTHHSLEGEDLKAFYLGAQGENAVWDRKVIWIEEQALSIREIEEDVILANWPDPRVLYGLYYGAKGGPFIMNRAFGGGSVYAALEDNARSYLNATSTVEVSRKKGVQVPLVFQWHASLFGGDPDAVIGHLKAYADGKLAGKLAKAPAGVIRYSFDWTLNDIPKRVGDINLDDIFRNAQYGPGCGGAQSSSCFQSSPIYSGVTAARRE